MLCHLYQECLAFSAVEGWLYPRSTHAGALIPSGAVFGHQAEKVIKEKNGYKVGSQLGLKRRAEVALQNIRKLENVMYELWKQTTMCWLLTLVL